MHMDVQVPRSTGKCVSGLPLRQIKQVPSGTIVGFLVVQILAWIHVFSIVHDFDVYMRAG